MKQKEIQHETWLDLSEAADYLGVHFTTLRRWADAGKIPFIRTPGGRRRFSMQALQLFVQQLAVLPEALSTGQEVTLPVSEQAIDLARKNIHSHASSENWMSRLNDDQRMVLKGTGHRLMVLLLQYSNREEGSGPYLDEGKRFSRQYSQICASVGFSLEETVRIFLLFRRSILDSIHETNYLGGKFDHSSMSLFHRTSDFMDGLLLEMIRSFPGVYARNEIYP